jgi:negative regulator of replication initiation
MKIKMDGLEMADKFKFTETRVNQMNTVLSEEVHKMNNHVRRRLSIRKSLYNVDREHYGD